MHARALATGDAPPVHNPAEAGAWNGFCRFCRVLWVCRVSVVSLAFGFFLMWGVPQAQDVFAEYNPDPFYWPLFFLVLAFGWAFPVHFAARWILRRGLRVLEPESLPYMDRREEERVLALYRPYVTWVPRALGVLCFAAVAIGIWKARANLEPAAGMALIRRSVDQMTVLFWANAVVAVLFTVFLILRRDILDAFRQRRMPDPELASDMLRSDERPAWDGERALGYAYVLVLSLAFVAAVAFPIELVGRVYRAVFLTLMLGAPVFALTWVAYKSHVTRAPLILALVIVCALVSLASLHAHDLRVLDKRPDTPAARQLRLDEAVAAWRRVNGCEGDAACPSPIIVTGQGGASRAAFFTASALGELLDKSPKDAEGRPQFAKQLFALSTVSGSSLGAIAVRAAFDDAKPLFQPPCEQWSPLWHGRDPVGQPKGDPSTSWRDCLQLLVSGDYLSPTFVGLAFRDNISIPWGGRPLWADRATILERAWEQHYRRVVGKVGASEPVGLERPFGYNPAAGAGSTAWSPLLFLNGSTVGSGRRVIAADVLPWTCLDEDGTKRPWAVYSEAFDLFEILGGDRPDLVYERSCAGGLPERGDAAPDVALSTAATVSARFPIVSPPGTLRLASGEVFEHVVDGGYFDNDGLTTARDIAVLLRRSGLVPTILRITNEPASAPPRPAPAGASAKPESPPEQASIPRPVAPEATAGGFLISFVSPVTGLYNTRAGHGSEAAREAIECVDDREGPSEYLHVAVLPSPPAGNGAAKPDAPVFIENVSMSWWLSQPVQAYLEAQTVLPENKPALDTLMARLDPAATARPPAVPGCYARPPKG